jgi:hypothetical protein
LKIRNHQLRRAPRPDFYLGVSSKTTTAILQANRAHRAARDGLKLQIDQVVGNALES